MLERAELAKALNNSHALANVLLTPQTEFTSAQIRKAKELYKELFDLPSDGTDARTIGAEWLESTRTLSEELGKLLAQKAQYPFVVALEPLAAKVSAMVGKPATWYITEPAAQEDDLLDAKEDVLDKVRSFMGGAQREIYDDARDFLRDQEANISYVDAAAGEALGPHAGRSCLLQGHGHSIPQSGSLRAEGPRGIDRARGAQGRDHGHR